MIPHHLSTQPLDKEHVTTSAQKYFPSNNGFSLVLFLKFIVDYICILFVFPAEQEVVKKMT